MKELLQNFRKRLTEYRSFKEGKETSIHINAMEMALCLSEYFHYEKRRIKKEELSWFEAGLQLEYVLGGSEWEDLLDFYDALYTRIGPGSKQIDF